MEIVLERNSQTHAFGKLIDFLNFCVCALLRLSMLYNKVLRNSHILAQNSMIWTGAAPLGWTIQNTFPSHPAPLMGGASRAFPFPSEALTFCSFSIALPGPFPFNQAVTFFTLLLTCGKAEGQNCKVS